MELPKTIQNKNKAIADTAVTTFSQTLKSIPMKEWTQIAYQAGVNKDTTLLENKLKPATKATIDDAIKEYKNLIIGSAIGIFVIGFVSGYLIKK